MDNHKKGLEAAYEHRFDKALNYLHMAVSEGDYSAISDMGVVYENLKMYEDAFKCYTKASEYDLPIAFYNIGNMYHNGRFVEQDYDKALNYFYMAYDKGYLQSAIKIAEYYREGLAGLDKNYKKAFEVLSKAYEEANDKESKSSLAEEMARCYELGLGVNHNKTEAFNYYKIGADLGSYDCMCVAAYCYSYGYGVGKDIAKALELAEKAAEGNNYANIIIGDIYAERRLGYIDMKKAEEYYLKSANQGNDYAFLLLAKLFLKGDETTNSIDIEKARRGIVVYLYSTNSGEYDDEYYQIKEEFKDTLDWQDLEKNAKKYFDNYKNSRSRFRRD